MFTGIIEEIGVIKSIHKSSIIWNIQVEAREVIKDLASGDSIAVDGVCLTVTDTVKNGFRVDISEQTRENSHLGDIVTNQKVNLERALIINKRLCGHLVTGHSDTVAIIKRIKSQGISQKIEITFPEHFRKYVAAKGSICVDGISLTVASCKLNNFTVSIIPHTLKSTTLQYKGTAQKVNLEFDIIAKYLESLFQNERSFSKEKGLDLEYLKARGF
jgi:riboflavin synthase